MDSTDKFVFEEDAKLMIESLKAFSSSLELLKNITILQPSKYDITLSTQNYFKNNNVKFIKKELYNPQKEETNKVTNYTVIPIGIDYLVNEYKARLIGNNLIEVDDEVVYLKTKYPDEYMLCAIDKDVLYQTEGEHYNYVKDEFITVTKEDTIKYLFYQALVGDASDGYKGCKGIGDKKAKELLSYYTDGKKIPVEKLESYLYKMLLPTFISKGHNEDYFLQTLRLASMHQYNGSTVDLFSVK